MSSMVGSCRYVPWEPQVKLNIASGCEVTSTVNNLNFTALDVHFESQCLPTWISYYVHMAPKRFKHFSTAMIFYVEIILPPLFLLPFKYARYFSFGPQVCFFFLEVFCVVHLIKFPPKFSSFWRYYLWV